MLDSMRGLAKSFASKALMMFLVLTFAVWGVGDIARSGNNGALVTIGDQTITPAAFMAEQRNMQRSLEGMGVKNIPQQALADQVLRSMVQQKLIAQWQQDTGLKVSKATLAASIAQEGEFKAINGKFDPALFKASLAQRGMNEASYQQALAQQIGSKAMLSSISTADMDAPQSLLALAAAADSQQRDVVLFTLRPGQPSPASVSDEDAQNYYDDHQSAYTQPERRNVEYLVLDSSALQKKADAAVTDASRASEEREQAVQDIAMAIEDALAGGSNAGEAVASTGIPAQSKLLKDVTQDSKQPDPLASKAIAQAFELGEGETSSLQSTDDGRYFLVHVASVTKAAPRTFDEVRAQVRLAVAEEQARDALRRRVAALKAALAEGKPWESAAAEAKATTRTVSGVTRPRTDAQSRVVEQGRIPALLQQAVFEHKPGGVAGPMTNASGEQVLALVTATRNVKAELSLKAREAAIKTYETELAGSVSEGVLRALSERYKITVNQQMMAQLLGGAGNE